MREFDNSICLETRRKEKLRPPKIGIFKSSLCLRKMRKYMNGYIYIYIYM